MTHLSLALLQAVKQFADSRTAATNTKAGRAIKSSRLSFGALLGALSATSHAEWERAELSDVITTFAR
jgi:hypothetical protein